MNRYQLVLTMIVLGAITLSSSSLGMAAPASPPWPGASSLGDPAGPWPELPTEPVVIRLYVRNQAHLNAVAGKLDIWEAHPDQGYVVAAVRPAVYQWLKDLGYSMEVDAVKTDQLRAPLAVLDPRYHYFDNDFTNSNNRYIVNFLQDTQSAYPGLVELIDIGNAWQASHGGHPRDMWVLRITNENPAYGPIASKPVFFLFADAHAREVVTPELAIRYIKYLTSGYNGQGGYNADPDVTWLVDYNVAYVLVTANPDGHRVDEQDINAYRRKNMDNDDGCASSSQWGVDLNRNHSFKWGCCGGSSGNPCDETYRGPTRNSEPETQAFQAYFATVVADQNGPNGDDEVPSPAPADATGIFISLHSYSDLVLWPWGWTSTPAPNANPLSAIGHKFAYFNGYDPSGSIWYTVDGATDDWTYGKFGIASFTFEVGPDDYSACSDFFPAYGCIDGIDGMPQNFWAENKPAFIYAHKIARTPYLTVYGPDALNVTATPGGTSTTVELTARLDDTRYAGTISAQPIAAGEYYIDTPPWVTTTTPISHSMAAADGAFDETIEDVRATVNIAGLSAGRHILFVRGRDSGGNWGAFSGVFFDAPKSDFELSAEPVHLGLCAPGVATSTIQVEPVGIYTHSVSLAVSVPAGITATLTPAVVTPTGVAALTINAGQAASEGDYKLVVSGTAQMTNTHTQLVSLQLRRSALTASLASEGAVALGQPAHFTATVQAMSPLTYTWDFGGAGVQGGSSARPTFLYNAMGDYTVVLTVQNRCSTYVTSTQVSIVPPPVWQKHIWVGGTGPHPPSASPFSVLHPTDTIRLVDRVWITDTDPITFSLVDEWSPGLELRSVDISAGSVASGTQALAWNVVGGLGNTWHIISKTFRPAGDSWQIGRITETLTVSGAVAPVAPIYLEFKPCAPVHIDALQASDPATAGQPVYVTATVSGAAPIRYTWDLDGDGTPEQSGLGLNAISHVYTATGVHTITLDVANSCPSTDRRQLAVTVMAPPAPPTYTLTVHTGGSGAVALDPAGGVYTSGTLVTLTATPATGWAFAGWSGALSGAANPAHLTMDADKVVTATFTVAPPPVWQKHIWIGEAGPYGPGASPFSVLHPTDTIRLVDQVHITETDAVTFSLVDEWSPGLELSNVDLNVGSTTSGAQALIWNVTGGLSSTWYIITKTFRPAGDSWQIGRITETLTVSGAVTPLAPIYLEFRPCAPVHIDALQASDPATAGQPVYVTATVSGAAPIRYTWDLDGDGAPEQSGLGLNAINHVYTATGVHTITLDVANGCPSTDKRQLAVTVMAPPEPPTYTLTVHTSGSGAVALDPAGGVYTSGALVTLTATPATGWAFVGWSGALSGAANPAHLTMDADKVVTATFSLNLRHYLPFVLK